jgi:hypothetical protein
MHILEPEPRSLLKRWVIVVSGRRILPGNLRVAPCKYPCRCHREGRLSPSQIDGAQDSASYNTADGVYSRDRREGLLIIDSTFLAEALDD